MKAATDSAPMAAAILPIATCGPDEAVGDRRNHSGCRGMSLELIAFQYMPPDIGYGGGTSSSAGASRSAFPYGGGTSSSAGASWSVSTQLLGSMILAFGGLTFSYRSGLWAFM